MERGCRRDCGSSLPGSRPNRSNHLTPTVVELTAEERVRRNANEKALRTHPRFSCCSGKAPATLTPPIGTASLLPDRYSPSLKTISGSVTELECCRLALRQAIKRCLALDFPYVSCAISVVLNSLRPLYTWEISAAVDLFVQYTDAINPVSRDRKRPRREWLQKCGPLMIVDDTGLVHFSSRLMPHFLRRFRIRGIDTTHQTIATACLIQVELDEKAEPVSLADSSESILVNSCLSFSEYASTYWRNHCQNAEEACREHIIADTRVKGNVRASVQTEWNSSSHAEAGVDLEKLTVKDDDDWIMIDSAECRSIEGS